jgi:hypothetical protein
MSDKRIICRTELLDTITDERERALHAAELVAQLGIDDRGVTMDAGLEALCLLREAAALRLLRDEVAALTKHAPSAGVES